MRSIDYDQTDFYKIFEELTELNPEEDVIEDVDELVRAKAYLIILRNRDGIQVVGLKQFPKTGK